MACPIKSFGWPQKGATELANRYPEENILPTIKATYLYNLLKKKNCGESLATGLAAKLCL